MSNVDGERRGCGNEIFRGKYCETCFYEKLSALNQEYETYRNAMLATVEKITGLFVENTSGSERKKN